MYRISQTVLASIGIGSTPAEQFQLWRNGREVPIYTSVPSGTLSGSDFIEFWGEKNDGKPDRHFIVIQILFYPVNIVFKLILLLSS